MRADGRSHGELVSQAERSSIVVPPRSLRVNLLQSLLSATEPSAHLCLLSEWRVRYLLNDPVSRSLNGRVGSGGGRGVWGGGRLAALGVYVKGKVGRI